MRAGIVILLFFVIQQVAAQNQFKNWVFGYNNSLDFNTSPPGTITGTQIMGGAEATITMSDASGNLLFYSNSCGIYTRNHNLMPGSAAMACGIDSQQGVLCVPLPGSSTIYYVFTTAGVGGTAPFTFYYSVLDMTLNNGFGDIVPGQLDVPVLNNTTEILTAVPHCNGQDYWIVVHEDGNNVFKCYLFDQNGLNTNPVVSAVGASHVTFDSFTGMAKASPGGTKLAATCRNPSWLDIFDFDIATGVISNPVHFSWSNLSAIEFSPNGRFLYAVAGTPELYQFDLCDLSSPPVIASSFSPFYCTSLQHATDGRIYAAFYHSSVTENYVSAIMQPDQAGTACNFTDSVYYAPYMTGNFPNNYYTHEEIPAPAQLSFSYTQQCENVNFTSSTMSCSASPDLLWNFGNTASGTNNTAQGNDVSHVFSSVGSYTVTLIRNLCSGSDTTTQQVTIQPAIIISGADTLIPIGSSVQLTAAGSASYSYVWTPSSGLSCTACASPVASPLSTTGYIVTATNEYGCSLIDTVIVYVDDDASVFIPSAFSPNGDGSNDVLYVLGKGIEHISLSVFDRWGEMVFVTNDLRKGWDGTYKGRPLNSAVFTYTIEVGFFSGQAVKKSGNISLIR